MSEPVSIEVHREALTRAVMLEGRLGGVELLLQRWQRHAEVLSTVEGFEVRAAQLAYCVSELRQVLRDGGG